MKYSYNGPFLNGYTSIVERRGILADVLMDFGVIVLKRGETYEDYSYTDERCFVLGVGNAEIFINGNKMNWTRSDRFEQAPYCLSVSRNLTVKITTSADQEVEVFRVATPNDKDFYFKHFNPEDCENELRGSGTMQETATRIVRTIFNFKNHPDSNLVAGEVVNMQGKWSSYPPHHHPQPEIYHYRFKPNNGFGLTCIGEKPYKICEKDTVIIRNGEDHPQVAAPGYAMWYLWIIRHLPENNYINPDFTQEHIWVTDPKAAIWSPKL